MNVDCNKLFEMYVSYLMAMLPISLLSFDGACLQWFSLTGRYMA